MERPNATQVAAASAILKKFAQETRGTAADTAISSAVYSIFSALSGIGQPAEQYSDVVKHATGGDFTVKPMIERTSDGFKVLADNPLGLPVGNFYVDENLAGDEAGEKPKKKKKKEKPADDQLLDDELPTGAELKRMNKAELIRAADFENVEGFDDGMTNDEMIEAILEWRKDKDEEEEGNDTPSGE